MLYYTIIYYTILYYTVLCYTILYYTILYYTKLYYTNANILTNGADATHDETGTQPPKRMQYSTAHTMFD